MPEQDTQAQQAPTPPFNLRGDNVALVTVLDPAGLPVPILQIISANLFAAQIALSDQGIDQLIVMLEEVRRRRRGLVVASEIPPAPHGG